MKTPEERWKMIVEAAKASTRLHASTDEWDLEIAAHVKRELREAIAEMKEECARICDQCSNAALPEYHAAIDAAKRIRALGETKATGRDWRGIQAFKDAGPMPESRSCPRCGDPLPSGTVHAVCEPKPSLGDFELKNEGPSLEARVRELEKHLANPVLRQDLERLFNRLAALESWRDRVCSAKPDPFNTQQERER